MALGTTTPTTSAGGRTGRRSGSSWRENRAAKGGKGRQEIGARCRPLPPLPPLAALLDHHHLIDPVPLPVEVTLRVVERAQHRRIVAVHELGALGDPSREPADGHEGPGHLATIYIGVRVAGDEELLEQRQRALLGEDVQRLEDLGTEEATQQLVAADALKQALQ